MVAARISTLSALACLLATGCTLADQKDEDVSAVESAGKKSPGSTTTTTTTTTPTGPTCPATTDYTTDPANCGTCGNVCGSGLCYAGVCADATAGHVFVIGHGYETSNAALDRLVGNAVFINERAPVRVLAFAGAAPSAIVDGTNAAIDRYATARGRTWQRTQITGSAEVAPNIGNADVFLVYAQPQASDVVLYNLGDEWSMRLDAFARRGGVIVVLDTTSANSGTHQVLLRSGLMTLTQRASVGSVAYVGDSEDVASARMPLMFGLKNSVGWSASSSYSNVASSDSGQAVVVHRAIY